MDYRLSVDREHFLTGLRLLKGPLSKNVKGSLRKKVGARDEAIFGYDGQYLTIEARERMTLARAQGAWPGNALRRLHAGKRPFARHECRAGVGVSR